MGLSTHGQNGANPPRCQANALVCRDHFTSAPIRIRVFADRFEILSPGHRPDSLSIEDMRQGTTR